MRYEAEFDQLPHMLEYAQKALDSLKVDQDSKDKIRLALEEALVNVIYYAYGEAKEKPLELSIEQADNSIKIVLKDWGKPFDPSKYVSQDHSQASAQERPIGGLGIFFIKKMVDEVIYRYENRCNELTLIKKL